MFFHPAFAIDCPPGQFTNDTINCYNCAANTYCQGGVVNQCPQYSSSPVGSSLISQCVCQDNSQLNNGACMCNAGYVRVNGVCTLCPAGAYCPNQYTTTNCTNNAYSLPGSALATDCNICLSGWYKDGPLSCRRCLPGFVCPTSSSEIMCLAGTYAPALGTACVTCPANTYSANNASVSCNNCTANSASVAGSSSPSSCQCNGGYSRDPNFNCVACPLGYACSNNLALPCPSGSFAPGTAATCAQCPYGTYQPNGVSSACSTCPAGNAVLQINLGTEFQIPSAYDQLDTATNQVFINRQFLSGSMGANITTWTFYANRSGCVVTPIIFRADVDTTPGMHSFTYTYRQSGTTRTVSAPGLQTFDFIEGSVWTVSETTQVSANVWTHEFFGWAFTGTPCIPYQAQDVSKQLFFYVSSFPYSSAVFTYTEGSTLPPSRIYAVQVSTTRNTIVPATDQLGSISIQQCKCPTGLRKTASGLCQAVCADGYYMQLETDTVCSVCAQGSYCVQGNIYPCPSGSSSLPGSTSCQPCAGMGTNTNIALAMCGLKTCPANPPIQLGTSSWSGVGRINVGNGGVGGFQTTAWSPGALILNMELNPLSDRPVAMLQTGFDADVGQPIAIQFRYKCTGLGCAQVMFTVQWADAGGQFNLIFPNPASMPTADWVQTSTAYFTPTTPRVTLRIAGQLLVSSALVWLATVEKVTLGQWGYDSLSKLRLLDTMNVNVPHSSTYNEVLEVSTVRLNSAKFYTLVPGTTTYPGNYPYVASIYASGSGTVQLQTSATDSITWTVNSSMVQYSFTVTNVPTAFNLTTVGAVVIANPSLLLRSSVVGCQLCLSGYWCASQQVSQCPGNSNSPPGSSLQTNCSCGAGFFGRPGISGGFSPCSPCPKNYYCTGGNNVTVCPNGTKAPEGGAVKCYDCAVDEYCALGQVGLCPPHSTSAIDSWDITQCICDDGYYGVAPNCKLCEPGFYCVNGSKIACTDHATSTPGAPNSSFCFCDRGYYGLANAPCIGCEEGSWCWTGIKNQCPANMWSPALSSYISNCTCDYGYFPSGPSCVACSSGSYKAVRGTATCTLCGVGKFSMARAAVDPSTCQLCDVGTFAVSPGQYQCQACAAGYYVSTLGSTACNTCWAGSYSLGKASACTPCRAGTSSPVVAAPTSSVCTVCSAGWWSPGNVSSCTMCGVCNFWKYPPTIFFYVQTLVSVLASTTQHYCFAVNNINGNIFMAMGTSVYYVDLNLGVYGQPLTFQIPARNWWFASIASSKVGNYIYAIQNTYAYRVDLDMNAYDVVYPSALATSIVEDSSRPVAVVWIAQPDGVRSLDPISAKVLSTFAVTGAYYVCLSPSDPDNIYVTGTFGLKKINKDTGATTSLLSGTAYTNCAFTPDGVFVILAQATTKSVYSYSTFDSTVVRVMTNALVSGMYVDASNMVFGIDSIGIKNVSYSSADSRTCSPGKYSGSTGLVQESDCTVCTSGNLCPGGSNITQCAAGTFSPATGLREQAQCSVCPVGSYCTGGAAVTPCPQGTYSLVSGLKAVTDCQTCSVNYFCPNNTAQIACPANTVSLAGSWDLSQCTCKPGYRCIIASVVHAEITLQITPADFTADVQAKYIAAVAAAAGVTPDKVVIMSVTPVTLGSSRRLLDMGKPGLEVHTSIYEAPTDELFNLNEHLVNNGLPSHSGIRLSIHQEVVRTFRV
jgi:Tyrosine-protein kinase ephrin type A/B receptor-like